MRSGDRVTHHPDTGLPQRVALGVLLRSFPPARVDEVLDAAGRREQRQRLLPARLMVYFTLGMWIFKTLSYEQILAEILCNAPGLAVAGAVDEAASAAAIGRARRRLGVEPLRLLFEQASGASAFSDTEEYRGLRPVRLRRLDVGVPASPGNLAGFGPAARTSLSLLVGHAAGRVLAADVADAGSAPERVLSGLELQDGMLIIEERPLCARLWTAVERLGGEQLWPITDGQQPAAASRLADGSALGKVTADDGSELVARVFSRPGADRPVRLATSILDHRLAPAAELAALYDARPAAGDLGAVGGYREGGLLELRSKDPEMVRQELYAMLCVHHAIGELLDPIGPILPKT
ncbi:MAG TPA: transposase domain-containing protein [Actinospica sp.]|nr:transposase domain-containing protein [Actinospica sp.]